MRDAAKLKVCFRHRSAKTGNVVIITPLVKGTHSLPVRSYVGGIGVKNTIAATKVLLTGRLDQYSVYKVLHYAWVTSVVVCLILICPCDVMQ